MIMVRKQRVKLEKMQLPACGHEAIEEGDAVALQEVTWLASTTTAPKVQSTT